MKKSFIIGIAFFLLSGCGISAGWPSKRTVSLTISKSPSHIEQSEITVKSFPVDLATVLQTSTVPYETEMHGETEFIRSLDGVVATASRRWQLYIDGKQYTITTLRNTPITQSSTLEWRYE
jgi:hypothetical protein